MLILRSIEGSSYQKNVDGKKIESGFKSEIISLVIDDPNNSRVREENLLYMKKQDLLEFNGCL
jgi:hypothetical protein